MLIMVNVGMWLTRVQTTSKQTIYNNVSLVLSTLSFYVFLVIEKTKKVSGYYSVAVRVDTR